MPRYLILEVDPGDDTASLPEMLEYHKDKRAVLLIGQPGLAGYGIHLGYGDAIEVKLPSRPLVEGDPRNSSHLCIEEAR